MTMRFEIFRSSVESWDNLFAKASEFATEIGEQRVINISHSWHHNHGIVTVWYWAK